MGNFKGEEKIDWNCCDWCRWRKLKGRLKGELKWILIDFEENMDNSCRNFGQRYFY